jgi:nucleoid-associated protein EbfC
MPDIPEGGSVEITNKGGVRFTLSNRGNGVLQCTCTAWKYSHAPETQRTCLHLRNYRGQAAEMKRIAKGRGSGGRAFGHSLVGHAAGWIDRAGDCMRQGQNKEAEEWIRKAIDAYEGMSDLESLGTPDSGMTNACLASCWDELATALQRQGRQAEAQEAVQKAAEYRGAKASARPKLRLVVNDDEADGAADEADEDFNTPMAGFDPAKLFQKGGAGPASGQLGKLAELGQMLSNPEGMNQFIQKAQHAAQQQMQHFSEAKIEGSAGGGAVRIVSKGNFEIQSIEINDDLLDPEDVETLEDLLLAALNDVADKTQRFLQEIKMQSLQGVLGR